MKPITPEQAAQLQDAKIDEDYRLALKKINEHLALNYYTGRLTPVYFYNPPKHEKVSALLRKAFEDAGWTVKVNESKDGTSWSFSKKEGSWNPDRQVY